MSHIHKVQAHANRKLYAAKSLGDVSDFNPLFKKLR